ncbi:hypothetical protein N781_01920 [Pontibacillus halophilus JSM 076056 = DSM 19796]|uniref:DUF8042 domain-containing protein n=1 Tax=Pontibacillus halophilus JSM 076056 = DSM 19796 TaxID=1385510 RepID=A0A0A5IE40_9BACI|nr:hypothetical protein [Pontibacillus halophilus]KGX94097.1 hypothetical protein N781_01920 [Pontibacillus halophilus JSM 076056 = DSM 19796]
MKLQESQLEFFHQYQGMLKVISEGFSYLEDNPYGSARSQVLSDLVLAFQKLSESHDTMSSLLDENEGISCKVSEFHEVVLLLSDWMEEKDDYEKLTSHIIPRYEEFRQSMEQTLHPYTVS